MVYVFILFFLIAGASLNGSPVSAPVVAVATANDDYQQKLQLLSGGGQARGGGGSTIAYERDLSQYKNCLKQLGASIVSPQWWATVQRSLGDAGLFLAGGALAGAAGIGFQMMMIQEMQRMHQRNAQDAFLIPLANAAGVASGGAAVMLGYVIIRAIAAGVTKQRAMNKMGSFLYSWPHYRHEWPQRMRDLVEPYYQQLSVNGVMPFSREQAYRFYVFLSATLNARVLELRADIDRVHTAQKKSLVTRMKENLWSF